MEKGEQDINTVLDTPVTFMMNDLYDENKKRKIKKSKSMLQAFGGTDPEAHLKKD